MKALFNFLNINPKSSAKKNGFFIHIPKTAGTSFRNSLKSNNDLICDYGSDSPVTSELVKNCIYEKSDYYELGSYLDKQRCWFTGHVRFSKYRQLFNVQQVMSIVRAPVEQVLSHYNHQVSVNGYTKDLTDFLEEPRFRNVQYKYLKGLPLQLFGMIGLQDRYVETVQLAETITGQTLTNRDDNVNPKPLLDSGNIPNEVRRNIESFNKLDVSLYKKASDLFDKRIAFMSSGQQWTHFLGHLRRNRFLSGVAFYTCGDDPVSLEFYNDSNCLGHTVAKDRTEGYPGVVFPRNRFIGFSIDLGEHVDLCSLRVINRETNQEITDGFFEFS